jgi:hypothetical protein
MHLDPPNLLPSKAGVLIRFPMLYAAFLPNQVLCPRTIRDIMYIEAASRVSHIVS